MVKPISPGEVVALKKTIMPDGVITAFNEVIAKHFDGRSATFTQNEVLSKIVTTMDVGRATVYDNRWLDVEDIYRAEGWHVHYDRPAYNETYEAKFTFTRR